MMPPFAIQFENDDGIRDWFRWAADELDALVLKFLERMEDEE